MMYSVIQIDMENLLVCEQQDEGNAREGYKVFCVHFERDMTIKQEVIGRNHKSLSKTRCLSSITWYLMWLHMIG